MRITRFATPAALVALASAFTPSCESAECAEEVCFEGQGGSISTAGAGGADAGQGGFSAAAGLSGTGGKTPTGGAGNAGTAGTPGSGGSAGSGASPEGGTDGGSNDGEAGSGGEGGAVPVCDLTQAPSSEACLVSDEFAVFVSPGGSDAGNGSKAAPLLSLAAAITLATEQQKVVLACTTAKAVFTAPLELSGDVTARVYGGFDCATWTYQPASRTLVAPAERGPALTLEGVSGALLFEDFEFRSKDALDGDGESSIAAVVSKSDGVFFSRVLFAAGKGGAGSDGASIAPFEKAADDGYPAMGSAGGNAQQECGCQTVGGRGGDADGSVDGAPGLPDLGGGKGGGGGKVCANGGPGADAPGTTYAFGAVSLGTLIGTSWEPSSGASGETGKAGQGGGGGGGEGESGGGAGGGGACGGCGGKGGSGGGGGGASIGLLLVQSSNITFQDSLIVAADAGDGGKGGTPQPGQAGGKGGTQSSGGCPGGRGGNGGAGGNGGGGAGGISVGILFRGTAPNVSGLSISTGMRGEGGLGGRNDTVADDGVDGDNPDTLDADA